MSVFAQENADTTNYYVRLKKKIKKYGGQCAKCPSVTEPTVDHIIPRIVLHSLGLPESDKEKENLQVLCAECNRTKGGFLDWSNPKTPILLVKYVKKAIKRNTRPKIKHITARCMCQSCV